MGVLPPPSAAKEVEIDRSSIAVAIVGRPNVGKSSLVNAITGSSFISAMISRLQCYPVQGKPAIPA